MASGGRITPEEVRHVARLARLELADDEVGELAEQLGRILEYAAKIQAIPTEGVSDRSPPLSPVALRPDEPRPGLDREVVLAGAPETEADRFRVPPVLEGG